MSLLLLFNQPINWTQQNNESFALSDNIANQVMIARGDSFSISEISSLGQFLNLSDILSMSESFIKSISIKKDDSISFSDSFAKGIAKILLDSISAIESFSGKDQHYLSQNDFITISDTIQIITRYSYVLVESLNLSDSLQKSQLIHLSDVLGITELTSNGVEINFGETISLSELYKYFIDSQVEIAINILARELNITTDEVKLLKINSSIEKNLIIDLLKNGLQ